MTLSSRATGFMAIANPILLGAVKLICLALLLCGCASQRGYECRHDEVKVITVGRTHFDVYSITNVVEETYYTPLPAEDNNGETVLKFSLLGAKTGFKWGSWGAEWPEVSNHVWQTWSFVYRNRKPAPQPRDE